MTTTRTDAAEAIAWRRRQHALICDDVRPWWHGTAVRASALPEYWDYNALRVEGPAGDVEVPELLAAADELQAGLSHRRVEVEDEEAGARLRTGFAREGWAGERLVWMKRTGPAPRLPAGAAAVREVPFEATRELRRRWHRGDGWVGDETAVERFLVLEARVAAIRRPRAFAAHEDDRLVGFASLFAPEGAPAAEVEQVFVAPERRDLGVGAALVAAALSAAARPVQWIVADDEGRPKRLYARLGFEPVWLQHAFVRRPRPRPAR